MAEEEEQNQSF